MVMRPGGNGDPSLLCCTFKLSVNEGEGWTALLISSVRLVPYDPVPGIHLIVRAARLRGLSESVE